VLDYGAVLQSVAIPTETGGLCEVLVNYASASAYEHDRENYAGFVVGRCCGRIRDARFFTGADSWTLAANDGPHQLHGGKIGLSWRRWTVQAYRSYPPASVTLGCHSPNGEDGYPGAVDFRVSYSLVSENVLEARAEASSDRTTPINITFHPYFNLGAGMGAEIGDHWLRIDADQVLPLGKGLLPAGSRLDVEGTIFDLRSSVRLKDRLASQDPQMLLAGGFDHYWVKRLGADIVAELCCPASGVRMRLRTNQLGLQCYTEARPNLIADASQLPPPKKGICLEPQGFPNAVNERQFPSVLVSPGQVYTHVTRYEFDLIDRNVAVDKFLEPRV
jgi:aldose 1-epimerase